MQNRWQHYRWTKMCEFCHRHLRHSGKLSQMKTHCGFYFDRVTASPPPRTKKGGKVRTESRSPLSLAAHFWLYEEEEEARRRFPRSYPNFFHFSSLSLLLPTQWEEENLLFFLRVIAVPLGGEEDLGGERESWKIESRLTAPRAKKGGERRPALSLKENTASLQFFFLENSAVPFCSRSHRDIAPGPRSDQQRLLPRFRASTAYWKTISLVWRQSIPHLEVAAYCTQYILYTART